MTTDIAPETETTETALCACGAQFTATLIEFGDRRPYRLQKHCPTCAAKVRAAIEADTARDKAKTLKYEWDAICPIEFRTIEEGGKTDVDRLRREQPLFDKVMAWQFGARGQLLLGPTGTGKTRTAYRIGRRELEAGRKFTAIKGARFGIEAVDRQMSNGFREWFDHLVRVPVLLVDDFGKGRFSDAVEQHWFGLIDERTENGRPIIVTTNASATELRARMSEDRGAPLIRRLVDYCEIIEL